MSKKIMMVSIIAIIVMAMNVSYAAIDIPSADYTVKSSVKDRVQESSLEKVVAGGVRSEIQNDIKSGGFSIPATDDAVTVSADGLVNVVTDDISISVYTPFGMLTFTQDIMAQLDTYSMMSDPAAIVEGLQEMGVHMYLVDLATEAEVYVSTSSDIVSMIVEDLDALSEAETEELIHAISSLEPNASIYSVTCGEHRYIVYDYRDSGSQSLIYTAIKKNTNIDFMFSYNGAEIGEQEIGDMEYLLNDVQLATL